MEMSASLRYLVKVDAHVRLIVAQECSQAFTYLWTHTSNAELPCQSKFIW